MRGETKNRGREERGEKIVENREDRVEKMTEEIVKMIIEEKRVNKRGEEESG